MAKSEEVRVANTHISFPGFFIVTVMGYRFEPHGLSPLGVRQKIEKDSRCESFLLRSLTPARLISFKQITSDEAESNQLLR